MDKEIRPVEIKDLNKTQLILLAILLSFVVSIATGITTVTLMQQASPAATQTINRVVQQTIEKVVPDYSPSTVQTVVVKEDDLVVDAVSKTRANLAAVLASKDETNSIADAYSIGNGLFVVSSSAIDVSKPYILSIGGATYDATVQGTSPLGFYIFSAATPDDAVKNLPASSLGKDADVKPGQTVVVVSSSTIEKGIAESVAAKQAKDAGGNVSLNWNVISLSTPPSADMIGSLAVDLDGNVIGLVVPAGDSGAEIVGVDAVSDFISSGAKNPSPTPSPASGTLSGAAPAQPPIPTN